LWDQIFTGVGKNTVMRLYTSTQTRSLWSLGGRHEAETFGTGVVHACIEMMDRGGERKLEVHPSRDVTRC